MLSYENWGIWVLFACLFGLFLGSGLVYLLQRPRLIQMETELEEIEDDENILQLRLDRAEKELASKKTELDGAQERHTALEAALKACEQEVTDARQEHGKTSAALDLVRKTQWVFESSLQERDAEVNNLRTELVQAARNREIAETAARAVENDLEQCRQLLNRTNQQNAVLGAEHSRLEQENARLTRELEESKKQPPEVTLQLPAPEQPPVMPVKVADPEPPVPVAPITVAPPSTPPEHIPTRAPKVQPKEVEVNPTTPAAPPAKPPAGRDRIYMAACPQHLSDVKGIGPVFEQRLYDSGIGSYWQVAQISNNDLKNILQLTGLQLERIDLTAIRKAAMRLAEETKTKGRVWSCQVPDDLEPIQGIGHTYEKRLYDAGVCTYEDLANKTVDELDKICQAPSFRKPNYQNWIDQAKMLAGEKLRRTQI